LLDAVTLCCMLVTIFFLDYKNMWKAAEPKDNVVLVTMDHVFKELEIDDALNVIHFDLPALLKKEAFGERYMTMWSHFPDITTYEAKGASALDPEIVRFK